MANVGKKAIVNLDASINTDTLDEDIKPFNDPSVPLNANTGINKLGGITNIQETELVYTGVGKRLYTDNGQLLESIDAASSLQTIQVDGQVIGQVSSYGVESRTIIKGMDDAALTADGTYIAMKLNTNIVTLYEFDFDGVQLGSRTVTFTNLSPLVQFVTSIGFVRYGSMHYVDSQEFSLRIGDQVFILQESAPNATIGGGVAASAPLGPNSSNDAAPYVLIVYNGNLVVAGQLGRVSSFDGQFWKFYDGSGKGTGPYKDNLLGGSTIAAAAIFKGQLVLGGGTCRVASLNGVTWNDYNSGVGLANNGTALPGSLASMASWQDQLLLIGGSAGAIACHNGTSWTNYNATVARPISGLTVGAAAAISNGTVLGSDNVSIMYEYNGMIVASTDSSSGRLACFNGDWVRYDGTRETGWTAQTGTASANDWKSVAYGAGIWVAVGGSTIATGAIQTSVDGITWTARLSTIANAEWTSVVYGNGLFVCVGRGLSTTGVIQTSPDGINWTARTSTLPVGNGWVAVTYGGGLFVAVASGSTATAGIIQTSTDGITWTARTSQPCGHASGWLAVAYGNGTFVISGSGASTTGNIQTSTDGITWTARTGTTPTTGWVGVTYGNGIFVCVSASTQLQTSPDGITWTGRTGNIPAVSWVAITYGNGTFVCVGGTSTATAGNLQTSLDGITWTARTSTAASSGWTNIGYGNNTFVVVGRGTSTTGTVQTSVPINSTSLYTSSLTLSTHSMAAYGSYLVVATGNATNVRISSFDGTNWKYYDGTGAGTGPYNSNGVIGGVSGVGIITFDGDLVVIGGDNLSAGVARMGSWDGSAWKNYDGTGSGTGIYSSTLVGTIGTTNSAMAVYGGLLTYVAAYVQTNSRYVVNSINTAGVQSQFYFNGSIYIASLFVNDSSGTYLYMYRYENGVYLINLVNSSLNTIYILNKTSSYVYQLYGKYAWPQYSNSKTRHIISETPRYSGSNLFVLSIVGYTDFITFQSTQQYPLMNVGVSSVLHSLIGWTYGDVAFKQSSSATNIYSYYGPQPVKSATALASVYQGNTDTLIQGHGKISNAYGVAPSIPVEIRVGWIPTSTNVGAQLYLSAAIIDEISTDAAGVCLTAVGEFYDGYQPQVQGDDTILYQYDGQFYIIKIGTDISNRLQRIDGRLYKINTLSPLNIYDSKTKSLSVGSLDYNGKMIYQSTTTPGSSTNLASVIRAPFSNSIDTGEKLVQIPSVSSANLQVFGYRIPQTAGLYPFYHVDTYISEVYSFSTFNDGSELVLPDPAEPDYVSETRIPVPIGATYRDLVVQNNETTIFLSQTTAKPDYDGYEIGNDTAGSYIAFVLFGQTYLFDGLTVYLATISDGFLQSLTALCAGEGMQFLASSPTESYFLSSFDNSVYTFNGGRNLTKVKAFTALPAITQAIYNVKDNTLLFDAAGYFYWMRDSIVTKNAKKANQSGTLKLFSTSSGIYISDDVVSWKYTYNTTATGTTVPLSIKTAYLGATGNAISMPKSWVVTLYNSRRDVLHVTTYDRAKDQDQNYEAVKSWVIKNADYDSAGYAHVRVQPKYQKALGSSLQIDIEEGCVVLDISLLYEDQADAVIAAGKSR